MNPQAGELNKIIEEKSKVVFEPLSERGKEIYFPKKGILAQSAEAGKASINATIGTAVEDDGTPMRLESIASKVSLKPDKIFLMIGINDIAGNNPDSIILWNYKQIIEQIQIKSTDTQLYVQSILPTNSSFTQYHRHQGKTDHILFLNQKLKELSAQQNLTYIDAFAALADAGNQLKPEYTNDGLHLMAEGYKVWIDLLKPFVNEAKCARKK